MATCDIFEEQEQDQYSQRRISEGVVQNRVGGTAMDFWSMVNKDLGFYYKLDWEPWKG